MAFPQYKLVNDKANLDDNYKAEWIMIDSSIPAVQDLLLKGFSTPVKFSDFVIPGRHFEKPLEIATLSHKLTGEQSITMAFTFPSYKERFYLWRIVFDEVPLNALVNIYYGKSSNRISFNSFLIQKKFYSSTLLIDFTKFFGVPMEFKGNDAILLEFSLPDSYTENRITSLLIYD